MGTLRNCHVTLLHTLLFQVSTSSTRHTQEFYPVHRHANEHTEQKAKDPKSMLKCGRKRFIRERLLVLLCLAPKSVGTKFWKVGENSVSPNTNITSKLHP